MQGIFRCLTMNYKLELNVQPNGTKTIFNLITFDTFKINIIDRFRGNMTYRPKLIETILKVRTLDNQLINTKSGNKRVILKDLDLEKYRRLIITLNSYEYKTKKINQWDQKEKYVNFMISLVLSNYKVD
jgi:hypothetical protein